MYVTSTSEQISVFRQNYDFSHLELTTCTCTPHFSVFTQNVLFANLKIVSLYSPVASWRAVSVEIGTHCADGYVIEVVCEIIKMHPPFAIVGICVAQAILFRLVHFAPS